MKRPLEDPDNEDQPPTNRQKLESPLDFLNNPKRWDVTFCIPLNDNNDIDEIEDIDVKTDNNNDNNNNNNDNKESISLSQSSDPNYKRYPCVKTFFARYSQYFGAQTSWYFSISMLVCKPFKKKRSVASTKL